MIKYLYTSLLFILPFNFQVHWKCLENGSYDLISKPINIKECKYSEVYSKNDIKIKIANKATLVLTRNDIKNGNYILFAKDKFIINDKLSRNNINYNYGLLDMYSFKNNDGAFYLLELNTNNGLNLNSQTLTLILLFSKNKMYISFLEWNSGDNSATSIGINKGKLFILNYKVTTIDYFEFENKKFIYNQKKSTKCKTDSSGKFWVPSNYKF